MLLVVVVVVKAGAVRVAVAMDENTRRVVEVMVGFGSDAEGEIVMVGVAAEVTDDKLMAEDDKPEAAGLVKCRSCLVVRGVPGSAPGELLTLVAEAQKLVVKWRWVAEEVIENDGWEGELLGRVEEEPSSWELAEKPKSAVAEVAFDAEELAVESEGNGLWAAMAAEELDTRR